MNKKRILYAVLILLIVIQFFRIDKENPSVDPKMDFIAITNPPLKVANIIKASCYDCHSFETTYPWYSNVAPVSWWVKHHIDDARKHLNFSTWADYNDKKQDHKLDDCVEEVGEGEMPLDSYTWIHGEAVLSKADREELVEWFESKRTYISDKK